MLFVNVGRKVESFTSRKSFLAGVLGFASVMAVLVAWKYPVVTSKPEHGMTIEEKETVVMDLERLDAEDGSLSQSFSDLRKTVLGQLPVVSETAPNDRLVWKLSSGLVFSQRFFQADSGTQKLALLRLVLSHARTSAPETGLLQTSNR